MRKITSALTGIAAAALLAGCASSPTTLADRSVTITRTTYGIPHITAPNMESLAYGVAYAYAQDNAINWLDWNKRDPALEDFVARLAAFRASCPKLRDQSFLVNADWRDLDGAAMTTEKWENPDCSGFELRLPAGNGDTLRLRFDRSKRAASLVCAKAAARNAPQP